MISHVYEIAIFLVIIIDFTQQSTKEPFPENVLVILSSHRFNVDRLH